MMREEPTVVKTSNKSKNDRLYKEPYSESKNVVDTEPTLKYDQVTSPTPKCSVYEEHNKIFIPVVFQLNSRKVTIKQVKQTIVSQVRMMTRKSAPPYTKFLKLKINNSLKTKLLPIKPQTIKVLKHTSRSLYSFPRQGSKCYQG